jgi:acyl dehydratase
MPSKIVIASIDDFRQINGKTLFESQAKVVTKEEIKQYCKAIHQTDWFHFDEERARQSDFGSLVAPGTMTVALIHPTYFEQVELQNLRALFLGLDRLRIINPLKADSSISLRMDIARVEERDSGFAVYYDFLWRDVDSGTSISTGTTIVRYWPE